MRYGIIGAPSSLGAFAPGQEQAPRALREAGIVERLGADDLGDLSVRRWRPDPEHRDGQNAAGVAEVVREVAQRVEEAVRGDRVPIVLGGDCTVGIGTVAGALSSGPLGLVYFDLHPDLNTPGSVPDGVLDWTGMAQMLGVYPRSEALLVPEDVLLYGRDPAQTRPGEQAAIDRLGLATVDVDQVGAETAAAAARRFPRYLVHFDVDVVDFVDLPLSENTGHNIGLPFATAGAVLRALAGDGLLALTVTEHNPLHGAEDGSSSAALAGALVDALGG
jgi:arginase